MLWVHLQRVMLPVALSQTLSLLVMVGFGSVLLGVGFAWAVTRHEFPGSRLFDWALALPLAFPAYVLAYVYVSGLAFDAPIATGWRALGLPASLFPEVRSLGGAAVVLVLALFPYVYLLMRATLLRHGSAAFDAARTLGASPARAFFRVVLPVTRAAWMGGLSLVLLETLADFGAMRMLGRDTLSTLIVQSWVGLGSLALAAQLALAMVLGVVAVGLLLHAFGRRSAPPGSALAAPRRQRLAGLLGWCISAAAALVVLLGVAWPLLQLFAWLPLSRIGAAMPWAAVQGTLLIAAATAIAAVAVALGFAALRRRFPGDRVLAGFSQAAGLGYAVPGTVMAVAVFWCLFAVERALGVGAAGLSTGLFALVLALLMRFQRVGLAAVDAALSTLRPSLMHSAALLGAGRLSRWWRVGLPVLRPGLFAAALLVFVEAMKELPATLMLRPFGWDTLAIQIYTATSEGLWNDAALPALLLVAVGTLPVLLLLRRGQ